MASAVVVRSHERTTATLPMPIRLLEHDTREAVSPSMSLARAIVHRPRRSYRSIRSAAPSPFTMTLSSPRSPCSSRECQEGSLRLFVFGLVVSTAAAGFAWLAFKESDPILTRPLVFLLPNWAAFLIPGPVKQWIVRRHMRRLGIDPDAKEADSRAGDGWGDG